jgi:hypothetical protein
MKLVINQTLFGADTQIREETLDGIKCVVAPCAMIEEGVWEGSEGPVFYPDAEIAKSARVWNHKPTVVHHPQNEAGQFITASLPPVIERSQIGILLNTRHSKKLRTECWFYEEKANRVDSRILANLRAGKQVETSTGLDADKEETEGEYGGKKYKLVARNFRPDHLAILPDNLGAYSCADGGGLLANEKVLLEETAKGLPESLRVMLTKQLQQAYAEGGVLVTANALSYDERTRQLSELLREKYGKPGRYWEGHVTAVYDEYCVFCDEDYKHYVQKFKYTDSVVSLVGQPQEAKRVVEYVTASGSSYAANSTGQLILKEKTVANEKTFDKKAHVDQLIGKGNWTEADRETLMSMGDDILEKVVTNATAAPPPPQPTPPKEPSPAPQPTPPAPQTPKVTFQDVLANSDEATQERFAELARIEVETKTTLVNQIKSNPNNKFDDGFLMGQKIPFLRTLAELAKVSPAAQQGNDPLAGINNNGPAPLYYGMGGTFLANQGGNAPEPLLPLSTLPEKATA